VPALRYPMISFVCFFIRAISTIMYTTTNLPASPLSSLSLSLSLSQVAAARQNKALLSPRPQGTPAERKRPFAPHRARKGVPRNTFASRYKREGGRQGGRDGGRERAAAARSSGSSVDCPASSEQEHQLQRLRFLAVSISRPNTHTDTHTPTHTHILITICEYLLSRPVPACPNPPLILTIPVCLHAAMLFAGVVCACVHTYTHTHTHT